MGGFYFSAITLFCEQCRGVTMFDNGFVLGVGLVALFVAILVSTGRIIIPSYIKSSWVAGLASKVDSVP